MLNGVAIERVAEFKFLGTVMDETLSWKSHLNFIRKKYQETLVLLIDPNDTCLKRYFYSCTILLYYLILPTLSLYGAFKAKVSLNCKKGQSALSQIKNIMHTQILFLRTLVS